MAPRVLFVSYHELGLKGKNRSSFELCLVANINFALSGREVSKATRIRGRILIETFGDDFTQVAQTVAKIPGVANVALSYCVGRDLTEMYHTALRVFSEHPNAKTFRVTAKRSNTDFKINSQELSGLIGAFLCENGDKKVQLKNPDLTIFVTVAEGNTYISGNKIEGAGGLPVGSSGKFISLLSSGIDSPVATWKMMRRGAVAIGLHFSGRPAVNDASERLVDEIAHVLAQTGGLARVYYVPFGEIQREIASIIFPDLRIIMYRRIMFYVAQRLAHIEQARVIVTGESLGQVASQTIENICAVDDVVDIPVFRPLIGDDKHDIIALANRIETFNLSIQDVSDCCTLFMPKKPETHVKLERIRNAEKDLNVTAMIEQCLDSMTFIDYPCRTYRSPKEYRVNADS